MPAKKQEVHTVSVLDEDPDLATGRDSGASVKYLKARVYMATRIQDP
jgi:hypothetical protein